ncbi:CYP63 cytochrome P450 monooxygenase-like protein [Cyathus striatus]|nr:CYP63 cytochrome P450 monooxygenase-like protein [Cyathus striatus]
MVLITPGVDFLAHGAAFGSLPVFGAVAIGRLSSTHYGVEIPTWMLLTASVLSFPAIAAIRIVTTQIKHRRQAAAVGARLPPAIKGKLVGNFDVMMTLMKNFKNGYIGDGLVEAIEELGHLINVRTMWTDTYFTDSPEYVKAILATDFGNFVKGERFQGSMGSVLGTGVFNSDGDMWKCVSFHRSITRPVFTRDRISHYELFDKHTQSVISHIKLRMKDGYPVDFLDLMSRFTLDSATEFLFGSCVHSLESTLPYPHNAPPYLNAQVHRSAADIFARAFLESQEIISTRERLGWIWPLWEITKDKTKEPMEIVNAYIEPIIKEAIRKKEEAMKEGIVREKRIESEVAEDETLLDHLVGITTDPVVLRDETLNIMIAGRDTTASTLTFIFYFLSRYPAVMTRLREEIFSKVGPNRHPTYDDIRDMKYLRAVINGKTLRLYPIVPFNVRESINATTWPSSDPTEKPYYIPAGTKSAYSVFIMQRRKDLWGPDADVFDPDRFLDERLKQYLVKNSFIFLPFNAGPRICLGQQFAYNEMSFIIIRLLQAFSTVSLDLDALPSECHPPAEWATAKGRKAIEQIFPKTHLTMYTAGGLWLNIRESESGEGA